MNRSSEKHGRKRLAWLLAVLMVLSLLPASVFAQPAANGSIAFQADQMGYWENGAWIPTDVAPYIDHGRIMVPVAHASRALGADVTWDGVTKTVSVTHGDDLITLVIGSHALMKNGELLMEMETPAVIRDLGNGLGRTMLPVSRLARALDVEYTWDADIRTATFLPMAEEGPVVYDEAGTYGPEENEETIDNDVMISADGVILQNLTITGTLTITEDVGEGDVTLNSVTVEGDTLIRGGGTDSIYINGGSYGNIIVQRTPTGAVRIVVTGRNRLNVEVDEEAEEQIVILEGLYDKVIVTAPNVRIITRGETKINELVITSDAKNTTLETSDDTTIEKAVVDGEDAVFEGGKGTVKKVEGDEKDSLVDKDNVVVSTTRSSGGGGSSSSPGTPPVVPPSEFAGGDGSKTNPYQVATAQQLDNVRNYLDKHFIQVEDIDLTDIEWVPIGDSDTAFEGVYNGNDKMINKLNIDLPDDDEVGLFGRISSAATVQNAILSNVEVIGKRFVGGLVGFNAAGVIQQSTVEGSVTGGANSIGGLVGENRGIVKNVNVNNVSVTGDSDVGGLVGRSYPYGEYDTFGMPTWYSDTGIIDDSHTKENVIVSGRSGIGGLVGDNGLSDPQAQGLIVNSSSSAGVTGEFWVGGLVGANSARIVESYSNGIVTGTSSSNGGTGGLAGYNWGHVEDCYSTGFVSGPNRVGGLVGRNSNGVILSSYSSGSVNGTGSASHIGGFLGILESGTQQYNYWDKTTSGMEISAGGTGYVTDAMIMKINSVTIYEGWDFDNIWSIKAGESYPYFQWQNDNNIPYPPSPFAGGTGTVGDPYEVATAEQLNEVRNHMHKHFIQTANINLEQAPWNSGEGWNPIGTESSPFKGVYNGDEYTIMGLYINRSTGKYQGLFGNVHAESTLININLVDSYVHGDRYTGTLAGYSAGEISSCSSVNVQVLNGWDYAGGLVGFNLGTISDSSTTGIVKTSDFNAGGLVGTNYSEITNCFSEADISPINIASDGYPYQMGGLVGYNSGGTIEGSHAKGYVTGWETIGGLVGENSGGLVVNSYAVGDVSGNEEYIGGLVGTNGYNSTIRNSYATGTVSGVYYVGGLIGYNNSLVEGSYHKIGTVSGSDKVGGLVGDNSGTIKESFAESNVSGGLNVGGLSGYSGYGEIKFSYAIGDVSGTNESIGGLVGAAQNTAIHDSYANGTVEGGSYVGGLAGYLSVGSSVVNCYSAGQVSGSSYVGGLIGSKTTSGDVPTVDDSYYDSETTNQSDNSDKGIPKTTTEMKTISTFIGWDFDTIWGINPPENNGYPFLRW